MEYTDRLSLKKQINPGHVQSVYGCINSNIFMMNEFFKIGIYWTFWGKTVAYFYFPSYLDNI